ncbi:hypothetical protein HII17_18545 [Thalassotalea sp. M1531]|uniref:Uncharacterized protein n=1 Tax=Thalassotalea algicola TaxID=2716224 RepID=A0A7Y0LFK0_9GAMM|nr:hypothetical protein [Thalassotalea algicola]NMP33551.1 hypothetical protein [Thalassotalea algicola]
MPLSRHFNQGRLLYFTQGADAISVYENDHMRWLAFDDVVQSAVRLKKPHQLTFPHQWALLMPLLSFTPSNIVELGLGAGNHILFSQWLTADINHKVIEANPNVIDIALRYFPISDVKENLVLNDAKQWLVNEKTLSDDWYIFDIYQKAKFHDTSYNELLKQFIDYLPYGSILSINFPEVTQKELMFWLAIAGQKKSHKLQCYTVPRYKNIVLHLIPTSPNNSLQQKSHLPNRLQHYWRRYQLQFGLVAS